MHMASKKCFYLIGLFIIAELPDDKIQGVSNLFLVSLMDIALAHIIIWHGFILSKSGAWSSINEYIYSHEYCFGDN